MLRLAASVVALVAIGCAQAKSPRLGDDGGVDGSPDGCIPSEERCNDLDDDCDGVIDNGFPDKGMACTAGVGGCERAGTYVCANDTEVACDAAPGTPTTEDCDGVDDDCDMKIDEDFNVGTPCDGPDADVCPDGVIACTSLTTAACNDTLAADPERCDGFDNDCDGQIDEGFNLGMACDGADTDACLEGQIVCDGAGAATCSDVSSNNVETCNGLDDDCRNGPDDPWPVGMSCSVGVGQCMRTGTLMCNGSGTDVACSATAGAPLPETCGNTLDEDCNGSDAVCPANDRATGAIDISAGGTFTVDLSAANDDTWAAGTDCGAQGGRDVFYQFVLPAREVVYFDTFGSNFDSVVRIHAGSCTALGAVQTCSNDVCGQTRSQGAIDLMPGTYCLVVDQASPSVTAGASSLVFRRGGRTGVALTGASGTVSGNTIGGTNLSVASCQANSLRPDIGHFFTTCPGPRTVTASTCTGTSYDSILYVRTGAATTADVACSDDEMGCGNGLQSRITGAALVGGNLHWVIVDGYGAGGNGPYTLTYAIQ